MILDTLTLINFMRFAGKHVIEFDGKEIVGVVAEWENESDRSNRSGKSCIIDALTYLLWGKTRAKSDQFLLCQYTPNSDYEVSGTFIRSDGDEVYIRRGRENKKPLLELEIAGEPGGDNQTIIDEVGMTYEEFIFGPCFLQGEANSFMSASPSTKAEMILRYLQSFRWEDAHSSASDKLKECRDNIVRLRGSLESLRGNQSIEDAENDRNIARDNLSDAKANLKSLRKEYKKLKKVEEKSNEREKLIGDIEDSDDDEARFEKRIAHLNEKKVELSIAKKKLKQLRASIGDVNDGFKRIASQTIKVDFDLANARPKLDLCRTHIEAVDECSGICPVLDEKCDRVDLTEGDEEKLREEVDSLDEKIDALLEAKSDLSDESRKLSKSSSRVSSLKATISAIDISMLSEYEQQLIDAKKLKKKLEKKLEKIDIDPDSLKRLDELGELIQDADEEKDDAIELLGSAEARVEHAEECVKKIKNCEELIETEDNELMMWNYIVRMYSRAGIPSHELEQAFTVLEDEINYVLGELDSGTTATMSSFRELKKWEENCVGCGIEWKLKNSRSARCTVCGAARAKKRRDEFTLSFEDDKANEDRFDMDSGGGKIIKSIGVRIALSLLKMRNSVDPLSILVLDECFGELDQVNQEKVLQVITSVAIKLGFQQILIITHTSIKDSFPNTLLVTRREYYSEISWR